MNVNTTLKLATINRNPNEKTIRKDHITLNLARINKTQMRKKSEESDRKKVYPS